jgi:RNA polymerase sigma-70 factor (ECF subfamily)
MHTTPVSLLEQLRQPDPGDAWVRFVRLYTPLLFSWARHLEPQEQDAADLVQDVFTLLVQKLPGFQYNQQKSFRAWLYRLMKNKWQDKRKKPNVLLEADVGPLSPLAPGASADVFEENEYQRHLVGRALVLMQTDFHPTTWKAFWEHLVCGRPAKSVGEELGITIGAVYAAKFRVMDRLRKELQGLLS